MLECANFGAIGSIGHVSETCAVHLEPRTILTVSFYYNVCME